MEAFEGQEAWSKLEAPGARGFRRSGVSIGSPTSSAPSAQPLYIQNYFDPIMREGLAGYQKALGADNTSTLNTVNNLGSLYGDQGKLEEAMLVFRQALDGYEKARCLHHAFKILIADILRLLRDHPQRLLDISTPSLSTAS